MSSWDVFHSERLEVLRGLTEAEIRASLAAGSLREDDLVRPAGTSAAWVRLAEQPGLALGPADASAGADDQAAGVFDPVRTDALTPPIDPPPPPPPPPAAVQPGPGAQPAGLSPDEDFEPPSDSHVAPPSEDELEALGSHFEISDLPPPEVEHPPAAEPGATEAAGSGAMALNALLGDDDVAVPLGPTRHADGTAQFDTQAATFSSPDEPEAPSYWEADALGHAWRDPQEEDEDAADFTLAPSAPRAVEEIDLTAMVDVSFQLILFFLVAATAVYLKTLEIPEPNPEKNEAVAVQPRTIEDLESDFILVTIDPEGTFTVDHEPVEPSVAALAARLREARRETGRTAMLLTADSQAEHRHAVLAYDAANEVGLAIAIARLNPGAAEGLPAAQPPARTAAGG